MDALKERVSKAHNSPPCSETVRLSCRTSKRLQQWEERPLTEKCPAASPRRGNLRSKHALRAVFGLHVSDFHWQRHVHTATGCHRNGHTPFGSGVPRRLGSQLHEKKDGRTGRRPPVRDLGIAAHLLQQCQHFHFVCHIAFLPSWKKTTAVHVPENRRHPMKVKNSQWSFRIVGQTLKESSRMWSGRRQPWRCRSDNRPALQAWISLAVRRAKTYCFR